MTWARGVPVGVPGEGALGGPRERTPLADLPSIFDTLLWIFAWSKIEGCGRSSKAVVSLVA